MADADRRGRFQRRVDALMAALARRGLAPGGITSLTVTGRRSGQPRTVPVTPIVVDGKRYLVAPYGPVDWVRNLRAAGTATLQGGKRSQRIRATELDAAAAAPVLKRYIQKIRIVRSHVDAAPDAPVEAFEAIAHRHPVFAISQD